MSDVRVLRCLECEEEHIEVDYSLLTKEQLAGREPLFEKYICERIARMYRVCSYALDTRVNAVKKEAHEGVRDQIIPSLKAEWGTEDFEVKLQRFVDLDLSFIGTPEEYYHLLREVVCSYVCGNFYPAQTAAGALGERILNRLILKTRDYFKSSSHYKKVYKKKSFDNWDLPIEVLQDWGVIDDKVAENFTSLKKYRNDSIHYNASYRFDENSIHAVKLLANIVEKQFSYTGRKDLFWVFNIPGEIWLRSEVENDPFVKEFVLPHTSYLTPYCEPMAKPPTKGRGVVGPLADDEFIDLRKNRKSN